MDKKRVTELSIIANNVRKHALTAVYSAGIGDIREFIICSEIV